MPDSWCGILLAVHISDGFLSTPWWLGGFALASVMWIIGGWKIGEREIPRIGVVTAAFFVASQVHLPTGVGTVHLVLNGLAGVLLHWRSAVAIGVGLLLQSLLFEHGGRTMIGVNCCIITLPAIAAGIAFPLLRRSKILHRPLVRGGLVGALAASWSGLAIFATQLAMWQFRFGTSPTFDGLWLHQPLVWCVIGAIAISLAILEQRLESDPDFALGLLLGAATVAVTVVLKSAVLWLGGIGDWRALAAADLVAHTPVIVLEGIGVGFAVRVLAKAKPEWLA